MGVLAKPIPFGDYFLLEKVNTGGMAEIFKAKTFGVEGFERIVAVKKILPSIAEDKEFISMFIDEAKIAVQLTHANIAQIFDLGNIDGQYYIAMEYVPGPDLRSIFDRSVRLNQKIDIGCICYIIAKLCEGLDYAHNKKDSNGEPLGLIHRDISPQNVLISYDGECKLIDFGIAKAATNSTATQVGILKGKFSYMSPEQVAGKSKIDRRSDIFALGIVLFEMLTLKRLFLGSSDFSTLEKIRKVEVSPPTLYNPNIPEELEDIVLKALEKDVSLRYQTANELQEALQRFMFRQNIYYTAKDLGNFCSTLYAHEIALEQKKMEFYKELTKSVLDEVRKAESIEDDTSFYDKQKLPKMSGVQYERVGASPPPKQAVYAELDDFQPPSDHIVYSQKPGVSDDVVKHIASTPIVIDSNLPPPRKSRTTMEPVLVNKGRETLLTAPKPPKNNTRGIFIGLTIFLLVLICALSIALIFNPIDGRNGVAQIELLPGDVKVRVELNGQMHATDLASPIKIGKLSTKKKTHYRIIAEGYEPVEGEFLAKEDGYKLSLALDPIDETVLMLFVDVDGAEVTIDGKRLEGKRHFSFSGITPGEHLLTIKKEGYKEEKQSITIEASERKSLSYALRPAFASIMINTEPQDTEFVIKNLRTLEVTKGKTGKLVDKLPIDDSYDIQIKDGDEFITYAWKPKADGLLETKGFKLKNTANAADLTNRAVVAEKRPPVVVKPKEQTDNKEELRKVPPVKEPAVVAVSSDTDSLPGILQISSKPPANIFINGKDRGSTPKKIELPAGSYTIKFVNLEQGIDSVQTVELKGGEVQKVVRQ